MHAAEIAFIDPGIDDLPTFLDGLRPEVEPILLDTVRPAARQMAEALEDRRGLEPIHVVAHGAPGRVCFSAGEWTADTVADEVDELAAVGRQGALCLWSCGVAAGPTGTTFVDALMDATGADIAAASGRVGNLAEGGAWKLCRSKSEVRPPLSATGIARYAGVLSVSLTSTGAGRRFRFFGNWSAGTKSGTYFVALNNDGALEALGRFIVPVGFPGTFAISAPLPPGAYTVGPYVDGPGTIAVYNGKRNPGDQPEGNWSPGDFNSEISATLSAVPEGASAAPRRSGAVR